MSLDHAQSTQEVLEWAFRTIEQYATDLFPLQDFHTHNPEGACDAACAGQVRDAEMYARLRDLAKGD